MDNLMFAAVDIGSNAARLLIKSIENDQDGDPTFTKMVFLRYPLRLGDEVFTKGKICKDKEDIMIHMMKAFKQLVYIYHVDEFRAVATSAMRDAQNSKDVISKIEKKTGIKIEIIPGDEEASLIYGNHIEQSQSSNKSYAYVDVGGGSTEITLVDAGKIVCAKSFNLGTVRMLHSTEEQNREGIEGIKIGLKAILAANNLDKNFEIVGSGGNINKLYRLSSDRKKKIPTLSVASLQSLYDELKPLSPEERQKEFELKDDRADVIVPAAEIFLAAAEVLKTKIINVPSLGLADGIIDKLYSDYKAKEIALVDKKAAKAAEAAVSINLK